MRCEPNLQRDKEGTGPETDKAQPRFLGCFVGSTEQHLTDLVSKVRKGATWSTTNFHANQGEHSHDVKQKATGLRVTGPRTQLIYPATLFPICN